MIEKNLFGAIFLYKNSNYLRYKYFIYTREDNYMVDAIGYVSKEQFDKSPELKAQYGSYEKFQLAQLKSQSIHTFAKENQNYSYDPQKAFYEMRMEAYDKHQKQSEAAIANYKELEAQYKALLGQQTSINNSLMSKYQVSNKNDLINTMSASNSLFDQGVYNKTSNSVNEAYTKFIAALQSANYQTHRLV